MYAVDIYALSSEGTVTIGRFLWDGEGPVRMDVLDPSRKGTMQGIFGDRIMISYSPREFITAEEDPEKFMNGLSYDIHGDYLWASKMYTVNGEPA